MKLLGDIAVIKMMLLKAREKLKTAQIDFNNERYDDSVSRTYYAVFHSISAVLLSKGLHLNLEFGMRNCSAFRIPHSAIKG